MSVFLIVVASVLLVLLAITYGLFKGQNLTPYDKPEGKIFGKDRAPCEEHDVVVASLQTSAREMKGLSQKERLKVMRENMDSMSEGIEFSSSFTPVNAGGVAAEWVVAPGSDPKRRLLYIHGGAFSMGSPKSHRTITNKYSEIAKAAVLAIDYRLMPEHSRKSGIQDCRDAYQWMLENGPDGASTADKVWVSGDSAGGNLTLQLIAWARDKGIRQVDAAIALSPTTDATYCSPSIKNNHGSDPMLGPLFGKLAKAPQFLILWFSFLGQRIVPSSALVSPVFGDLSNLPPTLVHASRAEVLFDDAKRYVNKAVAAGSPVKLQGWEHMVHVWHIFYPKLDGAREAWDEIERFMAELD